MELHLEADEVETLRDVLAETVSDLSPEIADTDHPVFRQTLVQRRAHLETILGRLRADDVART